MSDSEIPEADMTQQIISEMEELVNGLTPSDTKVNLSIKHHKLHRVRYQILKNAFQKIDTDHNGFIDPKELRVFLSLKWKQILEPATIDSVIQLADVDYDGVISFKEFARWQVKYMPLCRGYCMDCKKVILGIDGWYCQECNYDDDSLGMKRSFALCLKCFSKSDASKPEHEHPFEDFKRFSISGIGKEKVSDLLPTTEVYDRTVLKPLLKRHLMKIAEGNDDESYWNNALACLMQ